MVLALSALLLAALPATAQDVDITSARVGGIDRYATAALAMEDVAFPGGADTAIIATGEDFPDALTAAGLAGQADAALLLTDPGALPQATATSLIDLGVRNLYVLGGQQAVGDGVVEALQAEGRSVTRLGGADRYQTAAMIAREVTRLGGTRQVDGRSAAFLTTGEQFPDAVTAGAPAAADAPAPILLTETGQLPQATLDALEDLDIGFLWVLGGPAAVSDEVTGQLRQMGITVQRIAGDNRLETAAAVARTFVDSGVLGGAVVTLARSDVFPDALVGGVVGASTDGPVLLTESPGTLGAAAQGYLTEPTAPIAVIRAIGEVQAISPSLLDGAVQTAAVGHALGGDPGTEDLVDGDDYTTEVTACTVPEASQSGARAATGTVTNLTEVQRDLQVTVRFDTADGVRIDRGYAFVDEVDPGQTVQWRAVSFNADTSADGVTCAVDKVVEPSAGAGVPVPGMTIRYATIGNTAEGGGDAGDIDAVTYICYVYNNYAPVTCGTVSN